MDEGQQRKALLDAADKEIGELTGESHEYLKWIPNHAFPLAGVIVGAGTEVERLGRVLPVPVLKELLALYVSLHRYAFTAWQHRQIVELLLKPILDTRKM